MKAKLFGRLGKDQGYKPVEIEFQALVPGGSLLIPSYPAGITSFFLRYTENGKRVVRGVTLMEGVEFIRQHDALPKNPEVIPFRPDLGTVIPTSAPAPIRAANGKIAVTIDDSVEKFLEGLPTKRDRHGNRLADRTLYAYRSAVEDFRDHCGIQFVHEITKEVLIAHREWLYANLKKRPKADGIDRTSTTVANRFRYLSIWLRSEGIKLAKSYNADTHDQGLMNWNEVPTKPKKGDSGRKKYTTEEIKALMAAANVDEADLIQFFLRLGIRDEEAVYATWNDIDWKASTFRVQEKPKFHWRPKDKEAREIPFNGGLLERLKTRQERQTPKNELIFPNTLGKPDKRLIKTLQQVADRAGVLNAILHRFRYTFASMMISKCDLPTLQKLLGHSDIETTAGYLSADDEMARKAAATAFEAIGD